MNIEGIRQLTTLELNRLTYKEIELLTFEEAKELANSRIKNSIYLANQNFTEDGYVL